VILKNKPILSNQPEPMPLILSKRNENLVEWMDRPDCDGELLKNTYRQFKTINTILSGWRSIYKKNLRPVLKQIPGKASILDIGCGGGDIIRLLHDQCRKDRIEVEFTGIDPDSRSVEYLSTLDNPNSINYRAIHSEALVEEKAQFDIVISNHLVHHLNSSQLTAVCRDAEKLSRRLVIFSDIERSDIGYLLFSVTAPIIFSNSYIVPDGKISIRKSYRKQELRRVLPENWQVKRKVPFRLLAIYEKQN
jgi:2-polyprenyl-3-methyl-5-hydroxy-6-metoxy-1,4-benzoquinol methylase